MTQPITLELPMPPNLGNSRMHWRVKQREKKAYQERLMLLRAAKLIPRPPHPIPERVEIHVRMHVGARHDHDNAMARLKWPIDFLVHEGYVLDDDPDHLHWLGMPEQIVKRDGNYRIVITLSPA